MGWRFLAPLGLLLAQVASAYPTPVDFNGRLLRWNVTQDSAPITYRIVANTPEAASQFTGTIDQAAYLWTEVPTSYFSLERTTSESAHITINLEASLGGDTFSAGYALFDEKDADGPIHCSITVAVGSAVAVYAFAKTILHELGHCAGLGHTLVKNAIMSYALTDNAFSLSLDDQAALTRLYPADGSGTKLPPGCSVFAGPIQTTAWWLLLMPLLCMFGTHLQIAIRRNSRS